MLTRRDPGYEALGHGRHVTDVESAVIAAKAAAGDRPVMVHGAALAQSLIRADLLDEVVITLVPVLLGGGRRLFGERGPDLRLVDSRQGEGNVLPMARPQPADAASRLRPHHEPLCRRSQKPSADRDAVRVVSAPPARTGPMLVG